MEKIGEYLEDWRLINGCLMAAVETNGASAVIEGNILKVKLSCGIEIEVKNFIGNKKVNEELRMLSQGVRIYKK